MTFTLPDLPYAIDALEPHVSADTLRYHHGKHHAAYVDKLNGLVSGSELERLSLDAIILESAGNPDQAGLFNNAGQAWNHNHYWNCMKPGGGGAPSGEIADAIASAFGGYDGFRTAFLKTASGISAVAGPGWSSTTER